MYSVDGDRTAADLAESEILVLDGSQTVADAAREMRQRGVLSVLVNTGPGTEPVGIVTERDILYKVVAENLGPFKTTIKEIMTTPLVTVEESVPVADAIKVMRKAGFRRLPVKKEGKITGILTLQSLIGNSPRKSVELLNLEGKALQIRCPYCESKFEGKEELSKHMDRLHLGSGLLEGDLRNW